MMSERRIWARTTVEELMSRQLILPRPCVATLPGAAAQDRDGGLFRPGLRVVAIDGERGRQIDRWRANPAGVLIEG